jgi:hypothetical protein
MPPALPLDRARDEDARMWGSESAAHATSSSSRAASSSTASLAVRRTASASWLRRSVRRDPSSALDELGDDVILRVFSRAPFMTHGTLHGVCRRLKNLLRSREFRQQRVESGLAEHGLVVAGGWRQGRFTEDCFMLSSGRWRPISLLSGPRSAACTAVVENEDGQPEMWVMGGYDRGHVSTAVEAYNPRTNSWRSCMPLIQPRRKPVTGVVGGRLVIAGGTVHGCLFASVEAYTPTGWDPLAHMPHATSDATACVLDGRLYVMGGGAYKKLQVLERSEANGFSWCVKAELPDERSGAAAVAHQGKIWYMGGITDAGSGFDDVSIYDPSTDTWAMGPRLPRAVGYASAASVDGEIHLVTMESRETFVYREGAWVELAGNPAGTWFACASLLLG